MKKIVSVLLVVVMVFSLTACAGGKDYTGSWEFDMDSFKETAMDAIKAELGDKSEELGDLADGIIEEMAAGFKSLKFEITEDKWTSINADGEEDSVDIKKSANGFTIVGEDNAPEVVYDSAKDILSMEQDGVAITFKRAK